MQRCPKCQKDYPKGVDFCPRDGARTVPAPAGTGSAPRKAKTEIGNYVLVRKMGEGGMGVVFEAEHKMIQKRVALKMLHADKANDVQIYERFKREAKISSQIKSPHIVDITDFGQTDGGDLYLVMEYLEGKDLGHLLEQRKFLNIDEAHHILLQSSKALAIAHKAGVVHRDLKPDNVFLITKDGDSNYVKLLDFGIAKIAEASAALTKAGMIIGTPEYMSPEQCEGRPVDARSDIYSLGIIAYHMLTGKVPFSHEHFSRVLLMHSSEPPPPMRKTRPALQVSPVVEATIAKMMAKRREDRYQSMEEVLAALNTWNVSPSFEDAPEPTQIASAAAIMAQGKPMATLNLDSYEDAATQAGDSPDQIMNLGASLLMSPDEDENPSTVNDNGVDATLTPGGMMRGSPTIIPNRGFHPPGHADTQPSPEAVAASNAATAFSLPPVDMQKVIETTALPKLSDQLQARIANAPTSNTPAEEPQRSRVIVIAISAAVVAILAVVLYVFVFSKKTPPPTPPPAPVKVEKKVEVAPTQPAEPTPIQEKITLTIKTKPAEGVEVRIEGSPDLLGTLPGPIFVPMGDKEVKLEFSKRGYVKTVKAITPTMSQDFSITLAPVKKEPKEADDPDSPIKDPFKNP